LFIIEFDQQHHAALVIFRGPLGRDDIASLDEVSKLLIASKGPHSVVLDFSDVSRIDLTRGDVLARGRQPSKDEAVRRVIVTSDVLLNEFADVFAAAQAFTGSAPPKLVATRADALAWLGIAAPAFKPVDLASLGGPASSGT